MNPQNVPDATFHTRIRNPARGGENPFAWKTLTTEDVFAGKRIVLFALPGAFAPACSDSPPGCECLLDDFTALAAKVAMDMGLHKVLNLTGGVGAWQKANGPVSAE